MTPLVGRRLRALGGVGGTKARLKMKRNPPTHHLK